jgi:sortase (surface protein transpeptidase)
MTTERGIPHPLMRTLTVAVMQLLLISTLLLGGLRPAQAMDLAQPAVPQPVQLEIPMLEIEATIEAVGQNELGEMASPSRVTTVAWYNQGPRPGETGNAVIAGHLDDYRGRPAVFWDLDQLEVDDEVVVTFDDGSRQRFAVIGKEIYADDAAPLTRIFGLDFERDLNLITCDGLWNEDQENYSRRLVVYTRLIREVDDSPQTPTPSAIPFAPAPRPVHTRQDDGQPATPGRYVAHAL